MAMASLVIGYSGSGKSASMRNMKDIALVNVNSKPLPFRGSFDALLCSDRYTEIKSFMAKCGKKIIVIDDCQYLMANEFMRRSGETGYQKFTEMGQNFWDLVRFAQSLSSDVTVYFLGHIDTDESGREKFKTIGRLLDEKINVEGMFTIVLKTVVTDGKYLFQTQTNGHDTAKSPIGLFEQMYIDNDLAAVDEAIRIYYGLTSELKCTDCSGVIMPAAGRTAAQIAEGSRNRFGRQLCMRCTMEQIKKDKSAS